MKNRNKKVKLLLEPYMDFYYNKENEYFLKVNENKFVPTSRNFIDELVQNLEDVVIGKVEDRTFRRSIIPKEELYQFNPDNINNKKFWKDLHKKYKLVPICGGGNPLPKNVNEANETNFKSAMIRGSIEALDGFISSKPTSKILEIGYGYGNVAMHITTKFKDSEYYGIDLVKRMDFVENLYETDGWHIPAEIPKVDIVYSVNVFQHLSQKQRWNYYEKCFDLLNDDGIMIVSSFIMTEENKDSYVWGLVDDEGRGYCHFFSQPTEVDYDTELKEKVTSLGFDIEKFDINAVNHLDFVLKKRNSVLSHVDPYGEEN